MCGGSPLVQKWMKGLHADLANASALAGRQLCAAAGQGGCARGRPLAMRAGGRPRSCCSASTCVPRGLLCK